MTNEEIAKELEEKAKQDDIKSLIEVAKEKIPELYPSLIDHPDMERPLSTVIFLFLFHYFF